MKIFYAVTTALLLISQQACSEQQSAENTTDANSAQAQTAPAESHTIIEPAGDIKESVLGELKQGRWELVMFWATYCPVCKRDFEKLATFIEENPEIPLTVVGVVVDGVDEREKALKQINERDLNYPHVMTDFDNSNKLYQEITNSALIGVPSQLLYDMDNKLSGFSRNALDIDALEIVVYE